MGPEREIYGTGDQSGKTKPTLAPKATSTYQMQDFDMNAWVASVLKDKYGADGSNRDFRRLNRYLSSEEGINALAQAKEAHRKAEIKRWQDSQKALAPAPTPAPTPAPATEPVAQPAPAQAVGTTAVNPYAPKTAFYSPQKFDYDEQLRLKYGTDASRRDQRKFKRYWESDQRHEDQLAFDKAETDKMFASADARFKEINNAWKARNPAAPAAPVATAVTPQETPVQDPAPVQKATPILKPRKTNAEWDAIGAQKFKELGLEGAGTMADVRKIQELVGLTGDQLDGKWGNTTQSAYDAWLAQQKQQPSKVETPVTTGVPVAEVAAPEHEVIHIPGQGQVSTPPQEPVTTLGKAQPQPQPQHWGHRWAKPFEGATGLGKDLHDMFIWMGDNGMFQKQQSGYQQPRPVFHKQGGTMNRINYFQQGGATSQQTAAQNEDEYLITLVQDALQGKPQATQEVNAILEAAKQGDPTAQQQAQKISQIVEAIKQQQAQQTPVKRYGSKLNYIRSLKYAKGGKTCPACESKKVELKACGGKNKKKKYFGGGPFEEFEHGDVKIQTPTKYLGKESYSDKPKRVILKHNLSSMPNDTLYFDNSRQLQDVLGSTTVRGGLRSEETKDRYGTVDRWGNRNNSKAETRFEQYIR